MRAGFVSRRLAIIFAPSSFIVLLQRLKREQLYNTQRIYNVLQISNTCVLLQTTHDFSNRNFSQMTVDQTTESHEWKRETISEKKNRLQEHLKSCWLCQFFWDLLCILQTYYLVSITVIMILTKRSQSCWNKSISKKDERDKKEQQRTIFLLLEMAHSSISWTQQPTEQTWSPL